MWCPAAPPLRPVAAGFTLTDNIPLAFDPQVTRVTTLGRTITFTFKVNKVSLVRYQLTSNVLAVVYYGVYPVFDPAQNYTVSISRTCSGALLASSAYAFWYNATDIYGASTPFVSTSVNF